MSSVVLGIDIGTTSVSVVAIDESGRFEATATLAHRAAVTGLPVGHAEQFSGKIWQAVLMTLCEVQGAIRGRDVAAIGLTGQMHSTLLLDASGHSCSNIVTWQDKRAVTSQASGASVFDRLLSRIPDGSQEPTGCQLAPGYLGTTLFALRELNAIPASAVGATFVADWIAGRLCEQTPVTDRSHAASSGLYDFRRDDWSPGLLSAAKIDESWLPKLRSSGAVIGRVPARVAEATGLAIGTPVCNAIGDNQAAVLSSLPSDDGALLINIGTGGQILWRLPSFLRIDGMDTRYLPGDSIERSAHECQFIAVSAGLCGGDALAWMNRTVRQWLRAFGVDMTEETVWQRLSEQLDELPVDLLPVICEPFFFGTRPEPARRATFVDVAAANFTPANVARSILQGIAETMHGVYESAGETRPAPLTRIAMSGNGSRQNPMLVEAVRRRFGVSTSVPPHAEEAATGAALLAGVRVGIWENLPTAQQIGSRESRHDIF